ncbi:MAG: transcription antitermination factor NusB [Synergistaceae bacterium]|nr:transcription antitermination factor NusB [Synergistaceae bacterium]
MPEEKREIKNKFTKKKKIIGRRFEAIHRSRELAVQFLYSLDVCPEQEINSSLELFLNLDDVAKNDTPEVKKRCRDLSLKVLNRKNEIDGVLLRVVTGWRPERMMSVDRTILRLLTLEGFIEKTLPAKSAISEAVQLANDFGTKDSARFINGVMGKIEKFFEEQGENN